MAALDWDAGQVTRNLRVLKEGVTPAFAKAMYDEIEQVETPECRARTPVKTGRLQSTVRTVGPTFKNKTIFVGTTAGGPEAPYAVQVHERTEVYHANGQAKFIESVYRESGPYILQRVAQRVNLQQMMQTGKRV